MDPVCWLIKTQHHNCAISYPCLPELQRRHLTKNILINSLKYLHVAQSNGKAGGVCPAGFKRVWMIRISSYLAFKLLGYQTRERELKAALALQELLGGLELQDGTSSSLEGNLGEM